MAKGKEKKALGFDFDDEAKVGLIEVPKHIEEEVKGVSKKKVVAKNEDDEDFVSCLRNERVIIRLVPKSVMGITNPKHVFAGGMGDTVTRSFTVPILTSGAYVNILTKSEKDYLETIMGLEYNALSIYRKTDNYWENFRVRCTKQDTILDLSNPDDYIKYKVLLANKDHICPSLKDLEDRPKMTYQFVIIVEGEETKAAKDGMSITMECYKEYGKIESESDILRVIIETIESRPLSKQTSLEFLQTRINSLIQNNPKTFLAIIKDKFLPTKVLIKQCIEAGLISNRGNFLYVRDGDIPLCNHGEEPTLNVAAKFLNLPKNNELKLVLEAKLKY